METKNTRIEELAALLNKASDAYYNGEEIMSNFEYDKYLKELEKLEAETGYIPENSPTHHVGAKVPDSLPKEKHAYPALSLDKTKDIDLFVKKFADGEKTLGNKCGVVLMPKCDGATVVLTYRPAADLAAEGRREYYIEMAAKMHRAVLDKAVTRGDGETGSVITQNAFDFEGIPRMLHCELEHNDSLVVRGEVMMSYKEFDRINEELPPEEQYANARNLANATMTMLNPEEAKKRKLRFFAFNLVSCGRNEPEELKHSFIARLNYMDRLGINTVLREKVSTEDLKDKMQELTEQLGKYEYPTDGLVAALEDDAYAKTLPGTGHNPNIMQGYAFKWQDETADTVLRDIEWSPSRTGLLNPVAVFDPVELEGTTVSRATLHNVSYILQHDLKKEDKIAIYKANKIIPALAENYSKEKDWNGDISSVALEGHLIPASCPVCWKPVSIEYTSPDAAGRRSVVCMCRNRYCAAKQLGKFEHFAERDCMNITGLSTETLKKLIGTGFVTNLGDLYHIHANEYLLNKLKSMDGFGEKSIENLLDSIEQTRTNAEFVPFVHSLGIPNVGKGQAKLLKEYILAEYPKNHEIHIRWQQWGKEREFSVFDALCQLVYEDFDFTRISGIGPKIADSLTAYLSSQTQNRSVNDDSTELEKLLMEIGFKNEWPDENKINTVSKSGSIAGKTFVITGKLNNYANRDALIAVIEGLGGKVAGSVSKNTDCLINNDSESTSGKNKKAKELGIPVITEAEFIAMLG